MTATGADRFRAALARQRVVGIIRTDAADTAVAQGERLLGLGLELVEVTLTTPGALGAIERLAALDRGVIGVGSCIDASPTRQAIEAGAAFAVAPTAAPDMVAAAHDLGAAAIPAAFTPTEALACFRSGADAVKLFPASVFGPAGVRAILEPLPDLPILATGGVTVDTAPDWLAAGAVAVGLGGALHRATDEQITSLLALTATR